MCEEQIDIQLHNEHFTLLKEKCMFWGKYNALLIADMHFGKIGHFRKAGIPIPQELVTFDLEMISKLVQKLKVSRIIFLGDLFHSRHNNDFVFVEQWRKEHRHIEIDLIIGNHDILSYVYYKELNFNVYNELFLSNFKFTHIPEENNKEDYYNIAGHIHPSVKLIGKANQNLRLPCYFFTDHYGILPAFGKFTGTFTIQPKKEDNIYVVFEKGIMKV